jgi:hypothetical protein
LGRDRLKIIDRLISKIERGKWGNKQARREITGGWGFRKVKNKKQRRKTYDDSVPSVIGRGVHARLPQLGFLANDTTAVHAASLWSWYDARKDSLFDTSPEPTTEDERSKYNRGRDE